jgi:DNA-binding transcriptional LysR family regulator
MTRAADEPGVTHDAVSRQVRPLHETMGARLLARTWDGLVPTEAGAVLAERLGRGFREIEARVAAMREDASGALDLSCLGTFAMRWPIRRLGRFAAAQPGIDGRLMQSDAPTDFDRGRYDVAIRVTDHAMPDAVDVTPLLAERIGPVLSPALAERLDLRAPGALARALLLRTRTRPRPGPTGAPLRDCPHRRRA